MTPSMLAMIAALLGFVMAEASEIIPAIKDGENGSPATFSLRYYFGSPKNWLLMISNACGSGIMFLARHELMALVSAIPVLGDFTTATPVLLCGAIGFGGAKLLRKLYAKIPL